MVSKATFQRPPKGAERPSNNPTGDTAQNRHEQISKSVPRRLPPASGQRRRRRKKCDDDESHGGAEPRHRRRRRHRHGSHEPPQLGPGRLRPRSAAAGPVETEAAGWRRLSLRNSAGESWWRGSAFASAAASGGRRERASRGAG